MKKWKIALIAFLVLGIGYVWYKSIHEPVAPIGEWSKTFGGAKLDAGLSVQQTKDGGYIIIGSTRSYGASDKDVWLIKTDSIGNKEWSRTFGVQKMMLAGQSGRQKMVEIYIFKFSKFV